MIDKEFLKTLTILYVEDDLTIQKSLSIILSKIFGEVFICNNGIEALEKFRTHKDSIDAVVSDINMPQMNGIEMTRSIRELDPDIPILFTTAHGEAHYLMDAIKLKVSHYALKPIDTTELLKTISDLCVQEHNKKLLIKKSQEISEYTSIIDQLALLIHTDVEGKIVFANEFAQEISQYDKKEMNELHISKLFHKDTLLTSLESMQQVALDSGSFKKKLKFVSKNDDIFYLNLTIIPEYNDSTNKLEQFVYIGFDQTNQELEKQQTMQRIRKNMVEQRTKESELQKTITKLQDEIKLIKRNSFNDTDAKILMEKLSKEKAKNAKLSNQVTHYEQQIWIMEKEKEKLVTSVQKEPKQEKTEKKNKELQKLQAKVIEQQSQITRLENKIKNKKYV